MADSDLREYYRSFLEDIQASAHAAEALREDIFVSKMGELLEDYGEIESFVPCPYRGRGIKVDGYCFDEEFRDITLLVSCFLDEPNHERIKVNDSTVDDHFGRLSRFFEKSLKGLHKTIDVSDEAHDLAKLIHECRDDIRNVKLILVTNGVAKKRPAEVREHDGVDITNIIWDLERAHHFQKTGERERITIDFQEQCGGALPCTVLVQNGKYSTYLAFIPGQALADMYSLWGVRLLDMNVRVFLTAKGKVNMGIRETIRKEPEMFCAYNNGLTVFARSIETIESGNGGTSLLRVEDFQIVNGGQTTASLYHTQKQYKSDLSDVRVQMKLTVVHDESLIDELVPRISEYSNTQNKVQSADLAANQAPHPEIQAISKAIPSPDPTGGSRLTYWFYERARGSYEEYRNLTARTPARKREFDALRPKAQKFDKIRFGKVWNSYLQLPHVVSLGSQKNFARFNEWLRGQKDEDWSAFFRKTIALLILWREMEKTVRRLKYPGHHHLIVTYSLAWLFHLTKSRIHLGKIWDTQSIDQAILDFLEVISGIVNEHIRDTQSNIGEYAKKEECWSKLKEKNLKVPDNVSDSYIEQTGVTIHRPDLPAEKEDIEFCMQKGGVPWFQLARWLKERDFLTGKARSQCVNMGKAIKSGREPSPQLSRPCRKAWEEAEIRGWVWEE
ncbi:AIPR family protein [Desulfuromonas sp. TF]|uniref:AIPR family protein n=1 Tax=Desulfuromonas sp. TF TaxID=1232410 RepID=UPI0003FF798E|nr:AIPR family protein [Desulfuromonas sp. TF]